MLRRETASHLHNFRVKTPSVRPVYVEHLPELLKEGELYISKEFSIAAHLCCCGCKEEVITPLNPAQWSIRETRRGVSLYPSVGNWKFACQSHYWIKDCRVLDAGRMSELKIQAVIRSDCLDKAGYREEINLSASTAQGIPSNSSSGSRLSRVLGLLKLWWSR